MLWEIEIRPKGPDGERLRACGEYETLTHTKSEEGVVTAASRGWLLEGQLTREQADRLARELLVDPLVETGAFGALNEHAGAGRLATVLYKPGVMDPAALSVADAARDLGVTVESVRSFRRYYGPPLSPEAKAVLFRKVLANAAIEQVVEGPLALEHLYGRRPYRFRLVVVPLRELDDAGLEKISRDGQLSLSLAEMRTIQAHFRTLDRDPTDVELETLAQTWSEHCSHKTLKGGVEFRDDAGVRRYENLLKETIFAATQEVRRRLGAADWCVSVFEDNAGVVRFDDKFHVCFKVETHNHPSAIEPYGGAITGLGGVIRDPMGTGLGAKPVCNTDVFCFGLPTTAPESLPPGVLHPRKVMQGVISGVRDYGNRMGIPTVNGAVCFDERYVGNPLVFCGTVGLIPVDRCKKAARPGDLIVAVGGRTGRDGIHGATFSSLELTAESDAVSGGAVQIGNAIAEKKLLDVLLQARDEGLYDAVTDCGAGGFSSAVGEMGEALGASVRLEKAPLKYAGLSYTEVWISESQERMILAVSPDKWDRLRALCAGEDVEATALGRFEETGRLRLMYEGMQVADLDMRLPARRPAPGGARAEWSCAGESPRTAVRGLRPTRHERPHRNPAAHHCRRPTCAARNGSSASTTTRCRAAASSSRWSASTTTAPATRRWSPPCWARGSASRSAAGSTRATATSTPTPWRRRRWTRRCATSSRSAPTRRGSPFSTISAGATPTGRKCSAPWCGRPRRATTSPSPGACRSSAARTASRTSTAPPAAPSSSRRRCSSARSASCPTCAAASRWT